jgi:hypothetical protein
MHILILVIVLCGVIRLIMWAVDVSTDAFYARRLRKKKKEAHSQPKGDCDDSLG